MEIWDGYFENETLANIDLIRGKTVPAGIFHIVCEILVRHRDGDYLLMQRDLKKPSFAGYYEATAGGCALKGEDKIACAKRELLEETGITATSLEEIGRYLSREYSTIFYQFLCITDCDKKSISLQEGETISYKWLSEREFISFINSDKIISIHKVHYADFFKKMGYVKE